MKYLFSLGLIMTLAIAIGCDAEPVAKKPVKPAQPLKAQPKVHGGPEIGTEAPEIVGEDLDGVEFKLSEYRGKVVMLDFYGDW